MRSPAQPGVERPNDEALTLVNLTGLMARSAGDSEVAVGLLDGPVATDHPAFVDARVRAVDERLGAACVSRYSDACAHGTFVAGILAASRDSGAPAICPDCLLLVRPIFSATAGKATTPSATPAEVADAIVESVTAGARVLNLSAAIQGSTTGAEPVLRQALDYAASRGVLVVAAAGNRPTVTGSAITRHPWVIPVVGYDRSGRPLNHSTLGASIGARGLGAPGEGIESLGPDASLRIGGGTSVAAAFVTGTLALLWSLFPRVSAHRLRSLALHGARRRAVAPPMLNAESALRAMQTNSGG